MTQFQNLVMKVSVTSLHKLTPFQNLVMKVSVTSLHKFIIL